MQPQKTTIKLINPDPEESPEDICWHNLKICDEIHALELFSSAACSWIDMHEDKNFQDLEKLLREKGFEAHLLAKKTTIPSRFLKLNKKSKPDLFKYECHFCMGPPPFPINFIKQEWPSKDEKSSYEENFKNLEFSGRFVMNNKNEICLPANFELPSSPHLEMLNFIVKNKKKIMLPNE